MNPATAQIAELHAPANWRVVDFISDLHLQAGEPGTVHAWEDYMLHTRADAVFILGDLFEVWVGDDAIQQGESAGDLIDSFERRCSRLLQTVTQKCAVFFMHGNRDFLVGSGFSQTCNVSLLSDPVVLVFAGQRWLLSHGDSFCLGDTDYQRFRAQVRNPDWQLSFLARPLPERRAMARDLRAQSERRKQSGVDYADVDAGAVRNHLIDAHATTLIHGHTHRPGEHDLGGGLQRWVLSDWDVAATPPRAEVLRLSLDASGIRMQRLPDKDAC